MVKILSGTELVSYIKERQAHQVRALRQAWKVFPKLVIIKNKESSQVIETYVRMKRRYGDDILIETVVESIDDCDMISAIEKYNKDETVHGIIVQLPIGDPSKTDDIVNTISPEKDVDGLGKNANFHSATATAIDWLLAGYNVDLKTKKITIVGNGRLVGAPLVELWKKCGYDVTVLTKASSKIEPILKKSKVIVSATGCPRLIKKEMVSQGTVVVDAGTASENGVIVGDVDPAVRDIKDVVITPEKGGVGPLTIAALFDNVINSAQSVVKNKQQS